jgi:cell pole-organizing protein PopZ
MGQDGEASVEEILESIKKVIARDNRAGALEARRRRTLAADEAGDDAERFAPLRSEMRTEFRAELRAEPNRAHIVRDADEVLDLSDMEFALEPDGPLHSASEDAPLIAAAACDAMQENLAALAMLAEPGARPQIVRSGETSLEGLTRELLRPMLAEWLEANLPAMVEKLVQGEIARIVGKKP